MPRRRSSTLVRAVAPVLAASLLAGCASFPEPGGARLAETDGWSSVTGSTDNAARIDAELQEDAELQWSRSLGYPLTGVAATDGLGATFQGTVSEAGCNFFALSLEDGRKTWCLRLATAGHRITATVDGRGTTFLPQAGSIVTISHEGEVRWTASTEGTPVSITMLDNRHLLTITQFGSVQVFNTHTGSEIATSHRLTDFIGGVEPDYGLPWCEVASHGCPVPTVAAVDVENRTAFTTLWPTDADSPVLVALAVSADKENPEITEVWRTPLREGRSTAPVVFSDDRDEVYVSGSEGALSAFSASAGDHLWTIDLGYQPDTGPALTSDGLLVSGGRTSTLWRGPEDEHRGQAGPAPIVAVEAMDDSAEIRWRRDDLVQLTNPATTESGDLVVATQTGENGIELHVLDEDNGESLHTIEIPGAEGPASGLAIDPGGQILLSSAVGRVYAFGSPDDD